MCDVLWIGYAFQTHCSGLKQCVGEVPFPGNNGHLSLLVLVVTHEADLDQKQINLLGLSRNYFAPYFKNHCLTVTNLPDSLFGVVFF